MGGEVEEDADDYVEVSDDLIKGLPPGTSKGEPSIPSGSSTEGGANYFLLCSVSNLGSSFKYLVLH